MLGKWSPFLAGMGYAVHVTTTDSGLAALEAEWKELSSRASNSSPFSSWTWLSSWWNEIGSLNAKNELRVIVVREGFRLVGIAPFYIATHQFGTRVLRNLGDTHVGSEYLDAIWDRAHADGVIEAIETTLKSAHDIDAVLLLDLADDSLLADALARSGDQWVGRRISTWQTLPVVLLGGDGVKQSFLEQLSKNMRYNLRRKEKKLLECYPRARLELVTSIDELERVMAALFRLHALRWQSKGQTGNFVYPGVREFHSKVCPRLLEEDVLRIYWLDLDREAQQVGAVLYCLRHGKRELYLQAGMDPALEDLSAGFCLLKWVIERCSEEGLDEFDMLRGTEQYKRHWARSERRTLILEVARSTLRGILWSGARNAKKEGVGFLKRHLPAEVVRELKRLSTTSPSVARAELETTP
jgi:CelD/BcsL family acetyltransferase involved in cellulose biosynthesis